MIVTPEKARYRMKHDPAAAEELIRRCSALKKKGWRSARWRDQVSAAHPYPPPKTGAYMDHAYRLLGPDGRELFVFEPYGLDYDQVQALHEIAEGGWHVHISAEAALHWPGHTMAIWIEKAGKHPKSGRYAGNLESL